MGINFQPLTNEEVKDEKERLDAIILNLTRIGKYVLNERPEEMSFEDFRYIRRELNRVRQGYNRGGELIHNSKPSLTGPGISYKNKK